MEAAGHHGSGGPTTEPEPEPVTYILTQSFSHVSYGISHVSFVLTDRGSYILYLRLKGLLSPLLSIARVPAWRLRVLSHHSW